MSEVINHPDHYNTESFECIDVMEEVLGVDAVKNFCKLNAFKYLWRADEKDGMDDLRKARWYLERIQSLEAEEDAVLEGLEGLRVGRDAHGDRHACVGCATQGASPQVLRMKGEVMPTEKKHEAGFYFFDGDQWRRVGEAPKVKDPKDELKEAALQLHDLYESFTDAGFSRLEAMAMVCEILKGTKQ